MKFRARRQAIRTMTAEQERDLLARQRDRLLEKCRQSERYCPLIAIKDVYEAFLVDDEENWDSDLE